ncbi:hypothetical protein NZNM25_08950 [Nitrosopumilus zosterae]|uniref:Uncharacterized protein n=1 Tax=Nitrosopumilus zosterae TaxID=718286 RepID=A0A2S2KR64_9ARCH|nr:hypothetical protein [Nitrosopumilus zosterae]BDQ30462.1 hypothetical protein NZOSNM25_000565 [Nitrosopumilus zosterae]GBH34104.1 hypothetical protein NZNM25_08950 [Nitrosopumilus zosterae]
MKNKIILHEKILILIISVIMASHIVVQVIVPTINSQVAEIEPIPMVTLTNETLHNAKNPNNGPQPQINSVERTMVVPERPTVLMMLGATLNHLAFALFVAFAGIGIALPWIGIIMLQFPSGPNAIPLFFFWFLSMASIPLVWWFSKSIHLLRRMLYLYMIPVLVAGIGITYFTNFGA